MLPIHTHLIFAIGFLAQAFFSARILCQWILSERAKQVVSPTIYWVLSIFGAYLLFIYGWLRDDFAIIFGQLISYYIYIWNLNEKGVWKTLHFAMKALLLGTPLIALAMVFHNLPEFINDFFRNESLPLWMILFGSMGQIIFTLRFVYQWYQSSKYNESVLPGGFWIISLVGSGIIIAYGIYRKDPVLILGQSVGFLAYARNLILWNKYKKQHA